MTEPLISVTIPWRRIIDETAGSLDGHLVAGLGRHVTEDVVRFAMIRALVNAGVAPDRIAIEARDPALPGSRLDLVVDIGTADAQVVEIKYPRDPAGGGAADTMTLGELLRDLYRLALVECRQRLAVQVIDARLLRYLDGRREILGGSWPRSGGSLGLSPDLAYALPKTAADQLPPNAANVRFSSNCIQEVRLTGGAVLLVLDVDAAEDASSHDTATIAPPIAAGPGDDTHDSAGGLGTARDEILNAIRALEAAGAPDVTLDEVVRALRGRGTRYEDSTIRTMMSSWLLRTRPGHEHPDLERVDRGRYRTPRLSRNSYDH